MNQGVCPGALTKKRSAALCHTATQILFTSTPLFPVPGHRVGGSRYTLIPLYRTIPTAIGSEAHPDEVGGAVFDDAAPEGGLIAIGFGVGKGVGCNID